jgi:hypothetical protein
MKVDTKETIASIDKVKLELTRRLEAMVKGFASEVAQAASESTPTGDDASIRFNQNYAGYYKARFDKYGIEQKAGFHSGAWVISMSGVFADNRTIYSEDAVKARALSSVDSYKIGQQVYIGAIGPAYEFLEDGGSEKAPDGIKAPTLRAVQVVYSTRLTDYFNQG